MPTTPPVLDRINQAVSLAFRGDRPGAREALEAIWDALGTADEPFARCVLAHYMADTQDAPEEELRWDLRALDAALRMTDAEVAEHQAGLTARGMLPSLHLNLAEAYRKCSEFEAARKHIALALKDLDALPADGYGQMIRGGVERLAATLATSPGTTA